VLAPDLAKEVEVWEQEAEMAEGDAEMAEGEADAAQEEVEQWGQADVAPAACWDWVHRTATYTVCEATSSAHERCYSDCRLYERQKHRRGSLVAVRTRDE
jgi:hypothetical protein